MMEEIIIEIILLQLLVIEYIKTIIINKKYCLKFMIIDIMILLF